MKPTRMEQKAQALLAMKTTLEHLARWCHGDDRPACQILGTLASVGPEALPGKRKGTQLQRGRSTLNAP